MMVSNALSLGELPRRLLDFLAERSGQEVPARDICLHVWGYDDRSVHKNLKVHVSRLRCALREAGAPFTITCRYKRGYTLIRLPQKVVQRE